MVESPFKSNSSVTKNASIFPIFAMPRLQPAGATSKLDLMFKPWHVHSGAHAISKDPDGWIWPRCPTSRSSLKGFCSYDSFAFYLIFLVSYLKPRYCHRFSSMSSIILCICYIYIGSVRFQGLPDFGSLVKCYWDIVFLKDQQVQYHPFAFSHFKSNCSKKPEI